jgi:lipopolysaccharide transport system permease protein
VPQTANPASKTNTSSVPLQEFEQVTEASSSSAIDWKEIWRYRELFYFFAWRDIRIKYKQTVLGFLWVVLQPLLMMIIFTFLFGKALNIPSERIPYPVYVFSGLVLWNLFSAGLTAAANSMISNASIIKKVYFPRLVIPASSILVAMFDFLVALCMFIALLIYYGQPVSWQCVWAWPLSLLIAISCTLGLGCGLAALNVKYRDFRYVIPFLVQILFFVTPIIYPPAILPSRYMIYAISVSPMYAAIELFRFPITGSLPAGSQLALSLLSCVIFLVAGILYFRRSENGFVDIA